MPPEILALIDKPHLLIAVLAVGAFFGMTVQRFVAQMHRQAWRQRNRGRWSRARGGKFAGPWLVKPDPALPKKPDAADQLRIVMAADFTIQPLLNKSEARVFKELDRK